MAKKYEYIQGIDQNTTQTNHQKDLMSSKVKHNWAIPAAYSPCRYADDEAKHFPTEKLQN